MSLSLANSDYGLPSYQGTNLSEFPLVCVHGWGMNPSVFSELERHAEQNKQRFITIALPGHGASPLVNIDYEAWVDHIAAQIPQQSILLGWSLGGMLAMAIALKYPNKLAGLISVAASPKFVADDAWPGTKANVLATFQQQLQQNPKLTQERFLALQAMGSPDARQDIKRLKQLVLSQPEPHPKALEFGLTLLEQLDLREALAHINMPWLRVWGKLDGLTPIAQKERLQHLSGQDWVIAKASHAPFISHPQTFYQGLRQWMNGATSSP
ncbi:pimeloyl-ACP methyl ester esterase BioH [Paraferrimonas haliotis]|uniref:Pimeloyl-[acyl-carrier protein] methyl ester esterase n=1 Tax=Paraferrimonas haliotis TaxID=2013866 RepID=A0AA37TN58_9GAMM|nr:pimeloyl-ACP methyl ester esterase BioH [Paraferrimonas haliotis]GLS83488.1 pimeloyl-[acyl-carrier protein] methyl ester esterase [Paraferrimonas haliotis]